MEEVVCFFSRVQEMQGRHILNFGSPHTYLFYFINLFIY